jgi:hypothetical protein
MKANEKSKASPRRRGPKTLQARSTSTLDHTAAIAILNQAMSTLADASMRGTMRTEHIAQGIHKLQNARLYLERHDGEFVLAPKPPRVKGEKQPRLSPGLKLVNLKLSPELEAIRTRSAKERKAFASVPSFCCCIALPATQVQPPPQEWAVWAGLYGADIPEPQISKRIVKGWKKWAFARGVFFPNWKVAHPANEWLAWATRNGAQIPPPHITNLTIARWRKWAAEKHIAFPSAHTYVRSSGRYRLEMNSSATFGCPYGIYPRRLLVGIATCVKLMQQKKLKDPTIDTRIVHLGDTYYDAIKRLLGADYNIGGTALERMKHQFHALINSHILWWRDTDFKDDYQRYDFVNYIERGEPLSPEMEKHMLFRVTGMTMVLGEHFHRDCLRAAPIDFGIFDKLAEQGNCLAVDIFLWLTFRAWALKQQHRIEIDGISWHQLHVQFGSTYADLRHFRRFFMIALDVVKTAYIKPGYPTLMDWRETVTPFCKSVLDEKVVITLKQPSIDCAYDGTYAARGRFREAKQVSGNLF